MKALFISPHTDDVELGAGGTLTMLMEKGWEILWVVFSTAESSASRGHAPGYAAQGIPGRGELYRPDGE